VVPTRVEPGYGYIVPGASLDRESRSVAAFTEKPNATQAEHLITQGALWNSGLFAWTADRLLAEVWAHTPEIAPALPCLAAGDVAAFYRAVTEVSIDVGVLERSAAVAVVAGDFAWDDIGTWEALSRVRSPDAAGNVTVGPVSLVDSVGCIAWSEGLPMVLSGVSDLVVVEANGRLLILDRTRAAEIKKTLDRLPPELRELPE
jgi:mannose-1-phosphate guanylyltransferase